MNLQTQREMEQFHQIASSKFQIVQTSNQLVEREAILEIEKVCIGAHNSPNGKALCTQSVKWNRSQIGLESHSSCATQTHQKTLQQQQ